jgi:DNA-binding NarL/FixJ family response regulator
MTSRPRLLIVDDHKMVAEGLVRLLGDRFEILETINDGSGVLDAVSRLQPDVILLDLSMPNVGGLEVMRQLTERGVKSKTIILTMHAEANLAVESLRAGASGFALKESSGEELLTALSLVLAGGTYLTSGLTKEVITLMVGATDPSRVELTALQREVLRLIVRGFRAKEIAGMLEVSARSVEATKYKIMRLLNVHSTAELVGYAVEHRLVAF